MHGVDHERHRLVAAQHDARDLHGGRAGLGPQAAGEMLVHDDALDAHVAHAERQSPAARERRVGLEALQALLQRARLRDVADERAAALAADDLPAVLQAAQRGAQRAARDPEHRGQVVLGREAVALAVATRRQPVAQGLLGAVHEGRPGHGL